MTTVLDGGARPLDPRQEGAQRRLAAYTTAEHLALVRRVGCDHEAISNEVGRVWYNWCDGCRAERERELAEAGR